MVPPRVGPARSAEWRDQPTVMDTGYVGWLRARLFERPIRPDRSRLLDREGGGRLDRLDLWLVLVLLASVLTIRVWRLAEPYQMHFDEVYHPRTATEFLQAWRYGISHDIYEWTHPHLAKYVMAGGLVLFGDDRVGATSELGVPVRAAAIEPRWDESATAGARAGDRVYVATGGEIRAYDLATRDLVASTPVPGASAIAVDATRHRLLVGTQDGSLLVADTLALDELRHGSAGRPDPADALAPVGILQLNGPIRDLFAARDGGVAFAVLADDEVVTIDLDNAVEVGRVGVPGAAQLANAGTGSVLAAHPAQLSDPAAAARLLAQIAGRDAAQLESQLRSDADVVFLGSVPTGDPRTRLDEAVRDGRLAGVEVRQVGRVAVAGVDGVTFIDGGTGAEVTRLDVGGPALGLALVTGVDSDRLYVSVQGRDGPLEVVVPVAGDSARDSPTRGPQMKMPGQGGWVAYDEASQMVHVLGATPDGAGRTVYVIEPHGNAVYADAPLSFEPVGLLMDANQRYPSNDREQLLAVSASGAVATIGVGSHAFAWRLPGVIAGAILAVLAYLLARLLFRRREVAVITGILIAADGMLFAQSRIGMNDSYVGVLIMAAYLLFAAIWVGPWRSWRGFWLAMPVIGLLLGLALAAKWVAAYSIGALGILILTRSALGRLVLIAGMIVATTVLGFMAITVPAGSQGGNFLFLLLMVGLTAVAVVTSVVHPIAWSWEEQRLAVAVPAVAGAAVILGALAVGAASTPIAIGPLRAKPIEAAFVLFLLSGVVQAAFIVAGRLGFGPLAVVPKPGDPRAWLAPAAPAPAGWLRPGTQLGLPVAWMIGCLVIVPVAVYVASYLPWAFIENHQLWPGWPAGHTGQTLVDLTEQMYRYHNTLTAAHPASSPWWAWPFDLKPVWFYQESFAGGTAASIYDAGNLVSWWLAVPALAFVAWQAFRRRSLPLSLIAIGFACQWIAWARIDRAAFQYHYYTSLPFVLLALAFFLAELWHGASRRTWLLARLAGAAAVAAPMAMWVLHRPLCAFVRVEDVYPDSRSCPTLIPDFLLTARALAIAVVVGIGVLAVLRQFMALDRPEDERPPDRGWIRSLLPLLITAGVTMVAQLVVSRFVPDTPILTLTNIPVEPIAIVALLPLLGLSAVVLTARDARRFVAGALIAVVGWFLAAYPNIAALPLPYAMVNAYQGLLPTYVYTFQFPVSTVDRNVAGPSLFSAQPAILLAALTVTSIVLAYSAWSWRIALAAGGAPRLRFRLGRYSWPPEEPG
jgi:predicted membrane-bound dolichyl-phosphate-mannose-protein mannosyltransferase